MIGPDLLVGGGLLVGLFIGVFVVDAEPPIIGWLFGAGTGVTGGAFVAAITSNEPLVGHGAFPAPPPRHPVSLDDEGVLDDFADGSSKDD